MKKIIIRFQRYKIDRIDKYKNAIGSLKFGPPVRFTALPLEWSITMIVFFKDRRGKQRHVVLYVSEVSSDEESESSLDVVEGHEVVMKTSSAKTNSDDPDYLQLLEAHQQRLDDATGGNVYKVF